MPRTTKINEIVEERYQFCICLYRIKKEIDKRIKEKKSSIDRVTIFAKPCHIKKLFGPFLKTPQYTQIVTMRGHTGCVTCFNVHKNKLFTGSSVEDTIRAWKI